MRKMEEREMEEELKMHQASLAAWYARPAKGQTDSLNLLLQEEGMKLFIEEIRFPRSNSTL